MVCLSARICFAGERAGRPPPRALGGFVFYGLGAIRLYLCGLSGVNVIFRFSLLAALEYFFFGFMCVFFFVCTQSPLGNAVRGAKERALLFRLIFAAGIRVARHSKFLLKSR